MEIHIKPSVYLPFEVLPEGKNWQVGQAYRVKLVLRQVNLEETGAMYEVVDATSLESDDKAKRKFMTSDSGVFKA